MGNSVSVSVVMATYNSASLLPMSIESIISQTYQDWELIIIDDGSTDDTKKILSVYQEIDERIIVLQNKTNLGLAASLNKAINIAKGEFIARMDSDDFSFPQRLETQLSFLASAQDIDVLGAGMEVVDIQGNFKEYRFRPETHEKLISKIFEENPFFHPTIMARREFFKDSGGYKSRFKLVQDYELWLRTYKRYRFHNLQIALVSYREKDTVTWKKVMYSTYVLIRALRLERRFIPKSWLVLRSPLAKICNEYLNKSLLEFAIRCFHFLKKS